MRPGMNGPLTFEQRQARDMWLLNRRGLQFGVPAEGERPAVIEIQKQQQAVKSTANDAFRGGDNNFSWTAIGPQPMQNERANFGGAVFGPTFNASGRVSALAMDGHHRLYVGTASGGLWLSTDVENAINTGTIAHFTPISDNLPATNPGAVVNSVGSIALDETTDPPTIYLGTGEGNSCADCYYGQGIFQSSDLGKTWTPVVHFPVPNLSNQIYAQNASITALGLFNDGLDRCLLAGTGDGTSITSSASAWFEGIGQGVFSSGVPVAAWNPLLFCTNPAQNCWTGGFSVRGFTFHFNSDLSSPIMFTLDNDDIYKGGCDGVEGVSSLNNNGLPASKGRMTALWHPSEIQVDDPSCLNGITCPYPVGYAMIGNNPGTNAALGQAYTGFYIAQPSFGVDLGSQWEQRTTPCVHTASFDPPAWDASCGTAGLTLDGSNVANNNAGIFVSGQQFYDQALIGIPKTNGDGTGDADSLVFGGIGIYMSTDGGNSWNFLASNGGTHADQHALLNDFHPAGSPDRFFLGNDGGLFACTLGGNPPQCTWTALNDTINSGQLMTIAPDPTNNNRALAGFQDNGTQLYTGNLGWNFRDTGDAGFVQIDHIVPSTAYHTFASTLGAGNDDSDVVVKGRHLANEPPIAGGANVQMPNLSKSVDGGMTWDNSPTGVLAAVIAAQGDATDNASFYPPMAADPNTALRVFIGTHRIYVSTDAMGHFQRQTQQDLTGCPNNTIANGGQACALIDIQFTASNFTRAWTVSAPPWTVFNTNQADTNSGAAWNNVTPNVVAALGAGAATNTSEATSIAPCPSNADVAYLGVSGFTSVTHAFHIFRTNNFGTTWQRADGGFPDIPVLKLMVDNTDRSCNSVMAGTDVGVYRSNDGGATWHPFNLNNAQGAGGIPMVPALDIEQNDNGVVFVATHGRGAYRLNGPVTTPTPVESETPTPTATPTQTATATETATPTRTPTRTATFTVTASATATSTAARTGTPTRTATRTSTRTPTSTATPTASKSGTKTPGRTPTRTATSTATPTASRSGTKTPSKTPTHTPTITATPTASTSGTKTPGRTPTHTPTITATPTASKTGTKTPSTTPTKTATPAPTATVCGTFAVTSTSGGSGGRGSTVPSGGFKVVNVCAQPIQITSIVFGASDIVTVSGLKLEWQLGSQPPWPTIAAKPQIIANATPGTARITLNQPFSVPAGQAGFFSLSAVISSGAALNATSTQSVNEIDAVLGSSPVATSKLPANLGTVQVIVPVATPTATPTSTPTPQACGALTVTGKGSASGAAGATVQSGGFKIVNGCGQPMSISSLVIGVTDANVVSAIKASAKVGSPPSPPSVAMNQGEMIANASPGSVKLTFSPPLQVSKNGTAFFLIAGVLANNAPLNSPSTQSVLNVGATAGGGAVGANNLPATLGTIQRQ